jgi:hypothetical protein
MRRLVEIGAIRFGEFTQCFDEWERSGLVDVPLLRQSRGFLKATRFA